MLCGLCMTETRYMRRCCKCSGLLLREELQQIREALQQASLDVHGNGPSSRHGRYLLRRRGIIQTVVLREADFFFSPTRGRGNRRYFEGPKPYFLRLPSRLLTAKYETLVQCRGIFGPYFNLSGASCCCEMIPLSVLRSH